MNMVIHELRSPAVNIELSLNEIMKHLNINQGQKKNYYEFN